jgi:hypothetical protein
VGRTGAELIEPSFEIRHLGPGIRRDERQRGFIGVLFPAPSRLAAAEGKPFLHRKGARRHSQAARLGGLIRAP